MQKMDKRLFTGATTKITGDKTKLDGVATLAVPWKVRCGCLCSECIWYIRYSP